MVAIARIQVADQQHIGSAVVGAIMNNGASPSRVTRLFLGLEDKDSTQSTPSGPCWRGKHISSFAKILQIEVKGE